MRNLAKSVVFVASLGIAISTDVFADPTATDPVAAYTNANGNMPGLKQLLPNFEFLGGSVTEFVDALRLAARPRELNIIILDPMSDTKIAPVKLRNISVESALQLLRGPLASSPIDVTWIVPEDFLDNPVVYVKRPNTLASDMAERAVRERRRTTAVLSLQIGRPRSEDEKRKADSWASIALDAIEQALSFNAQSEKTVPTVRYHSPSGLLFVTGETSDLNIAREVVDRISQDIRDARKAEEPKVEIAQLRGELDALKSRDATAAAEALKPIEVRVGSDGVNILDLKLAVESAMRLAPGVVGRKLEITADPEGLVLRGDRELVRNAEIAAIGARTAIFMLKSRQAPSNGAPAEQK